MGRFEAQNTVGQVPVVDDVRGGVLSSPRGVPIRMQGHLRVGSRNTFSVHHRDTVRRHHGSDFLME